jgi:NAD(P)-dependent dehydrogenase (short-subunit alcohol dehydrogenase family)
MHSESSLSERTVLVTGASSGIGRAAAQLFAARGARIILCARDGARLEDAAKSLPGAGHIIVAAVLEDPDQVTDLLKSMANAHGEMHGIFHSAGVEMVRPMRMTKRAQIDALFGAAVHGSFGIARAASSKGVVADGGSLIFMSSVAGARGTPGMVAYSAAKAAVDGLVRPLACELAPRRIRVNSIAAGAVESEMHRRLSASLSSEGVEDYRNRHLLGFGQPEDVAHAALFLLSDASSWITGTSMSVDGGYAAR